MGNRSVEDGNRASVERYAPMTRGLKSDEQWKIAIDRSTVERYAPMKRD